TPTRPWRASFDDKRKRNMQRSALQESDTTPNTGSELDITSGVAAGIPFIAAGRGKPTIALSPLSPQLGNRHRRYELNFFRPLLQRGAVYSLGCRAGFPPETSMSDVAMDYACAVARISSEPVAASSGGALTLEHHGRYFSGSRGC